jgi:hypothetical protein
MKQKARAKPVSFDLLAKLFSLAFVLQFLFFAPTNLAGIPQQTQADDYTRYGKDSSELEQMDYLEFIARVTSHIPDKGQVMIRYHGAFMPMPTGER